MLLAVTSEGLWAEQIGVVVAVLVATELGYRHGKKRSTKAAEAIRGQATTVQASSLGLLALLLGFTLSMAESRFVARRVLTVDEANAIGTTYLRAGFLPEPERGEVKALLRRYVELRREFLRVTTLASLRDLERRAAEVHVELWARTDRVARAHPDWAVLHPFVQSLNELIDLDAAQLAALENHVPGTIVALLVAVAIIASGVTGLTCGLGGERSLLSLVVVPLLVAMACNVVIDLDRPRLGAIRMHVGIMDRLGTTLRALP